MVVLKISPDVPATSSQRSARKLLKKYSVLTSNNSACVTKESNYYKLKRVVPTISAKENISKLDVVLEAISYIQRLQSDLIGEHHIATAASTAEKESSRKCC
jgi:hypothetical protein